MIDFSMLDRLRAESPLVHCISNIVTSNDCANAVLAAGGSPMMAEAPEEAEDITRASRATVINTGTPNADRWSMFRTYGIEANRFHQTLVLDPVGAGASAWRRKHLKELLDVCRPTIIRMNFSEAETFLGFAGKESGVDSLQVVSREKRRETAENAAETLTAVVLMSGEDDIVTDGRKTYAVSGGSPLTAQVTGSGCMLSCLCGAFGAVADDPLEAAVLAAAFWKVCAGIAGERAGSLGSGSFRAALIDAASRLTVSEFRQRARIEEF